MPYKILQIIEKGKAVLVAVPYLWEQNGLLYWPKKNPEKLQKNEMSKPDENWSAKDCLVKRTDIESLQKAESIIDIMCENSDTEPDIRTNPPYYTNKTLRQYQHKFKYSNFNDMAEECSRDYNEKVLTSDGEKQELVVAIQKAAPNVVTAIEEPQNPIIEIEDTRVTNYVLPKLEEIAEDLKTVITTLITINQNQQIQFDTQNNILSKLSEMHTQFEEFVKQSFTPTDKSQSSEIKPISNLKDFQEFENLLSSSDSEILNELKKKFSILCGKGKGKGINNAYILIDVLFERNFLKGCSWTGNSKSDVTKICFKSFTKTIKFFFDIIHETDRDFTLVDCHKFLKIILRNAIQRCNNKQLRLSSKKNRQKKETKHTPDTIEEMNLPGCSTGDKT